MKKIKLLGLALITLAFAACTSSNTPEGATKDMLTQLQKGNYEKIVDMMHFSKELSKEDKAQMVALFQGKVQPEIEKHEGIASFEIGEVTMAEDGEHANVAYTINYGDGTSKPSKNEVIKVDGKWMNDAGK